MSPLPSGYSEILISFCFLLTFAIIAEAHFGLSETDCVFPLANTIELFQLSLVDTLCIGISQTSHGESRI